MFSDVTYAHSLLGRPIEEWQSLEEHSSNVAQRASVFATEFESGDWTWNAGLLHDFGKAAQEFQEYLRRSNYLDDTSPEGRGSAGVNHSSAGSALAEELHNLERRPFGRVLSYLIAGHHAGLPDYYSCDGGKGALPVRLEEGVLDLRKLRSFVDAASAIQRPLLALPSFVKAENLHFWIRMLFSCLVDADFLDTEAFMQPERGAERVQGQPLADLKSRLDQFLVTLTERSEPTEVNRVRHEILLACRSAANLSPGLFSLSVPTGGGKTLSATAFALDHAVRFAKRRIVYVIPYTSIIEQTSKILSEIFGPENVIEHHSSTDPDKETLRAVLASENWDASVVVTTSVQFFESLFAARPGRCRKLHNLVNSVIVLDEAQLVPPEKLIPCASALNELCKNYGATILLSTATQPTLPGLENVREITPSQMELHRRLRRTLICIPENLEKPTEWSEIADELLRHSQVLCVVNTRRDCYELHRLLPTDTIHLSALMCGEHRSRVIEQIKTQLREGRPVRVVSTQLVEAGVDIDFPVVFRALAGLDSIVQAAGRCNREGKLETKGTVSVFVPPKRAPDGAMRKAEDATKEIRAVDPALDCDSPCAHLEYFRLFYGRLNDTGAEILKNLIPTDSTQLDMSFRSVGDNFRIIDDRGQRSVFVRYGKGERLIEELRYTGPYRALMRKLQRYTVNIPQHVANQMREKGLIEEIYEGFLAQTCLPIYDEVIGLDVFSGGLSAEHYVL